MRLPGTISAAIYMIWASLVLSIANLFLYPASQSAHTASHHEDVIIGLTVIFGAFAVYFFVLSKIASSTSWARMLYLIFYFNELLAFLLSLPHLLQSSDTSAAVSVVNMMLQGAALALLYTSPGKEWFSQDGVKKKEKQYA